ncbi:hypothetical protein [Nocardia sp. NBC_00416]|uniref:hypothetical protein n=1 Tax=Nocardia sp. NBC_00416 TaxID=2975991 RepID=UPI002E24D113
MSKKAKVNVKAGEDAYLAMHDINITNPKPDGRRAMIKDIRILDRTTASARSNATTSLNRANTAGQQARRDFLRRGENALTPLTRGYRSPDRRQAVRTATERIGETQRELQKLLDESVNQLSGISTDSVRDYRNEISRIHDQLSRVLGTGLPPLPRLPSPIRWVKLGSIRIENYVDEVTADEHNSRYPAGTVLYRANFSRAQRDLMKDLESAMDELMRRFIAKLERTDGRIETRTDSLRDFLDTVQKRLRS